MALTLTQRTALKNDINADPALSAHPNNADGHQAVADAYNLAASPDFWVWRTQVSKHEFVGSTSTDGTNFSWGGAGFITRSQGERDAWRELFNGDGFCNPSQANVRTAFLDIFSGGTAPAPANRTHLATVARRKATRAEKLFATGTGSTASPALMGIEGNLSGPDIDQARNS